MLLFPPVIGEELLILGRKGVGAKAMSGARAQEGHRMDLERSRQETLCQPHGNTSLRVWHVTWGVIWGFLIVLLLLRMEDRAQKTSKTD